MAVAVVCWSPSLSLSSSGVKTLGDRTFALHPVQELCIEVHSSATTYDGTFKPAQVVTWGLPLMGGDSKKLAEKLVNVKQQLAL